MPIRRPHPTRAYPHVPFFWMWARECCLNALCLYHLLCTPSDCQIFCFSWSFSPTTFIFLPPGHLPRVGKSATHLRSCSVTRSYIHFPRLFVELFIAVQWRPALRSLVLAFQAVECFWPFFTYWRSSRWPLAGFCPKISWYCFCCNNAVPLSA